MCDWSEESLWDRNPENSRSSKSSPSPDCIPSPPQRPLLRALYLSSHFNSQDPGCTASLAPFCRGGNRACVEEQSSNATQCQSHAHALN